MIKTKVLLSANRPPLSPFKDATLIITGQSELPNTEYSQKIQIDFFSINEVIWSINSVGAFSLYLEEEPFLMLSGNNRIKFDTDNPYPVMNTKNNKTCPLTLNIKQIEENDNFTIVVKGRIKV